MTPVIDLPAAKPIPDDPQEHDEVTTWALAARDGDPHAVDRFVRATYSDVRRFVAHLSGDAHGAEDLTQDTFLRALHNLPQFAGRSGARTWLMTIARRSVIDRYRYTSARPQSAGWDDWRSAVESAQPAGLPGFDEGVALLDLLDTLDVGRRQAFVLTQLLGLPYAETAAVLDCPVGTVRSRVARARADLVALLRAAENAGTEPAEAAEGAGKAEESESPTGNGGGAAARLAA